MNNSNNQNNNFNPNDKNKNMQGKQVAKLATGLAKSQGKKLGKKLAKEVLKKLATKAVALLGSKAGVVIVIIIAVVILVALFVALITPDMSTKAKTTTEEQEALTKTALQRYASLGFKYNLVDIRYPLILDMANYENEYLLEYTADESVFTMFDMRYYEYIPPLEECTITEEYEVVNEETGETEIHTTSTTTIGPVGSGGGGSCTQISDLEVIKDETGTTKDEVLAIMEMKSAVSIEGSHPKRTFNVDDAALYKPISSSEFAVVEITYTGTPIEEGMDELKFKVDKREHVQAILEMPEAVDALFEQYNVSTIGANFGGGAYCVQDGTVDVDLITRTLDNAGVLKGTAQIYIDVAKKYNIDVVLMIAISLQETGSGTSDMAKNKNNVGGLYNSSAKEYFSYPDIATGIERMGFTLNNRINGDGKVTIQDLGSVYAPVGAANDPNGLNKHWVPGVSDFVAQLGGLTMHCEKYSSTTIVFDGDVSAARQTIASAGTRWVGNSKYDLGGGRNQSDISRGIFDCSSFVHWAYAQAGISLGNVTETSTQTLKKLGRAIPYSEIKVGDIIFWTTPSLPYNDNHVGIYVGNGRFIGSQGSTGVAIVPMNNSYWSKYFKGHVRRIIED